MDILPRLPGGAPGIAKRTVKDQISDKLAYMILTGLLRPGDELPSERQLAGTLGVARESVRSAIAVLQARRMIEVSQGARTRVVGPGKSMLHDSVGALERLKDRSLDEVAEARDAVEEQVIRLAAKRISRAALARLEQLLGEQEGMFADPVSFQISDREFHSVLYAACGNVLLADVVNDFYDYALDFRRQAMRRRGAIARSVADHRAIVAALQARDPAQAAAAMHHHLERVRKTTLREMAN
ncbi:MAG: FadR family transcriptional regulator [Betaproteobacteria bacterium]|nr:FadR family transcriptional regulator [Betaproteobacteria bacterium]